MFNFAPRVLMSSLHSGYWGLRSVGCPWNLKTARTLIIRVQSDSKDQSKVHWYEIPTERETAEIRDRRVKQEHLRIIRVVSQGRKSRTARTEERVTQDRLIQLSDLLEPKAVLGQWTSLIHMPMIGGRGEIWYIKTIWSLSIILQKLYFVYFYFNCSSHGMEKNPQPTLED